MAETRNSYLAEEPSKFEAHVVLSAYIPASMLDGQDAVPLLRRLLEQELPEKIKRNDGPEVEVRVLSIAPGSFVITFGVAFTIYKIVADYTKFKDGIRATAAQYRE